MRERSLEQYGKGEDAVSASSIIGHTGKWGGLGGVTRQGLGSCKSTCVSIRAVLSVLY